jgi:hypothetical protein
MRQSFSTVSCGSSSVSILAGVRRTGFLIIDIAELLPAAVLHDETRSVSSTDQDGEGVGWSRTSAVITPLLTKVRSI